MLIGPLITYSKWILIKILHFSYKKIHSKLCAGEFPSEKSNYAENVPMSWRHHAYENNWLGSTGLGLTPTSLELPENTPCNLITDSNSRLDIIILDGGFPSQSTINAKTVPTLWRNHDNPNVLVNGWSFLTKLWQADSPVRVKGNKWYTLLAQYIHFMLIGHYDIFRQLRLDVLIYTAMLSIQLTYFMAIANTACVCPHMSKGG